MSKRLVAYFSASGVTAKVAENLADAIGADIFEIQPEVPYTKADLNWMDKKSRSTIEMSDPTSRPAIAAKRDNMDEYDTIFVGLIVCTVTKQIEKLGVHDGHHEIERIIRVGNDNEQGRAAIPQQIQFHFIVGHQVTQLRNVKWG